MYKLAAVKKADGSWEPRVKVSQQTIKVNNPGIQQVRRFEKDGKYIADMIYQETDPLAEEVMLIDPMDPLRRKQVTMSEVQFKDLLKPIFRQENKCMNSLIYKRSRVKQVQK